MDLIRFVRWPILLLAAVAVAGVVAALAGQAWAWSVDLGSVGPIEGVTIGFGLALIPAILLTLVSGVGTVVAFYSARNLIGQRRQTRYALLEIGTVGALAVVVTTTSLPLFAAAWTVASFTIAGLVGHAGTAQALGASRQVRARLLAGDAALWLAVLVIGVWVGTWDLRSLASAVGTASGAAVLAAALLVVTAAVVRSALVPAHRWLPETAEAPSPVSALLHAGLVNGVGVLALVLWPLMAAAGPARAVLVGIGAATAVVATAQMRTRADLKGRLAASTSSQMGYLAIQAGLGIPAAMVAHVVGHGVWKASMFLGAGDAVARWRRADNRPSRSLGWPEVAAGTVAMAAVVLGAAVVPVASWAALTTPAELLTLIVAAGMTLLGVISVLRTPVAFVPRVLATGVILAGAAGYVLALRWLAHLLATEAGEPAPWGSQEGMLALGAIAGLLVLAAGFVIVDRRARRGDAPALVRAVGRASLRPTSLRERLSAKPSVGLAIPPVTGDEVISTRREIDAAVAGVGAMYPLTSFVASNPLAGLEDLGFTEAGSISHDVSSTAPGVSAGALRRAIDEHRVTLTDIDRVIAMHLAEADHRITVSGCELERSDVIRALVIDDDATEQEVARATSALRQLGLAQRTIVRTPVEAVGASRELQARVDGLGHHCCARTLSGTAWPAAEGPWLELRATGGDLDAALGAQGAGEVVNALPSDPAEAVAALFEHLGIEPQHRPTLLARVLTRNPGWPGHLVWRQRHLRLGQAAGVSGEPSDAEPTELLRQLVATRLVLEVLAAESLAPVSMGRRLLATDLVVTDVDTDVARLVAATSRLGFDVSALGRNEAAELCELLAPLAAGELTTLRSDALESAYRMPLVQAVSARVPAPASTDGGTTRAGRVASAQIVTCIDVRSERLRRNLESVGSWETFGAAGFFGVPLRFTSTQEDVSERTPALLRPSLEVTESADPGTRTAGVADALARAARSIEGTAGLAFGWAEAFGWVLAPVTAARTAGPAAVRRVSDAMRSRLSVPTHGRLRLSEDPQDLTSAAAAFLVSTGLLEFSPVVVLCGHEASITNNPHVAAYDCGACGGNSGDISARALTQILNDEGVRDELRRQGIDIPAETRFVAAVHDTTTDVVRLLDDPESGDIDPGTRTRLCTELAVAGGRTRDERMRLLPSTGRHLGPDGLLGTARARAADWAQPRPEWSLAGAAAIVVGPRALTEGLDLDGRVFLQSYRPEHDPDGSTLEQLLTAPVVVAQWITAQYWASLVDPYRFGAGDKTTHNVVGDGAELSAVVTGARGDLRIGLPWQAVSAWAPLPETSTQADPWSTSTRHQPQRLLAMVFADTAVIDEVMQRQWSFSRLVTGGWITLCAVDPATGVARRMTTDGQWVVDVRAGVDSLDPLAAAGTR